MTNTFWEFLAATTDSYLNFQTLFDLCNWSWDCEHTDGKKKLLPGKQLFKQLAAQRRLRIALLKPFICIPYSPLQELPPFGDLKFPALQTAVLVYYFCKNYKAIYQKAFEWWHFLPDLKEKLTHFLHILLALATEELWGIFWWSISDFFNIGCSGFIVWQLIDKSSFVGLEWLTFSSGIPIIGQPCVPFLGQVPWERQLAKTAQRIMYELKN